MAENEPSNRLNHTINLVLLLAIIVILAQGRISPNYPPVNAVWLPLERSPNCRLQITTPTLIKTNVTLGYEVLATFEKNKMTLSDKSQKRSKLGEQIIKVGNHTTATVTSRPNVTIIEAKGDLCLK